MLEQWSPAHHHYCMLISGASLSLYHASSGRGGAGGLWGGGAAVTSCTGRRPVGPGGGTSPMQASGVILREPLMCNFKKRGSEGEEETTQAQLCSIAES